MKREFGPQTVVRCLGWFHIGLGIGEIFAPRTISAWLGMPQRTGLVRLMGIRKVVSGVGILTHPQSSRMFWARAGGDAIELAGLLRASNSLSPPARSAIAAVAGVTALDAVCARMLTAPPAVPVLEQPVQA